MTSNSIAGLVKCWQATSSLHTFAGPATDDAIASVELGLGVPLPEPMKELYRFSDGCALFGGCLNIYPLRGTDSALALASVTPRLREWHWPVPDEVLVFGDDGSDELFGFWVGDCDRERFRDPVVQIGSIFEPGCMDVLATNFHAFLVVETALFLVMEGLGALAVEHLCVPEEYLEAQDEGAMTLWADPNFPDTVRDPYESRLDAAALYALLK